MCFHDCEDQPHPDHHVGQAFPLSSAMSAFPSAAGDGCDGETSTGLEAAPDRSVLPFLCFFRLMLSTWDFPAVAVVLSAGSNEPFCKQIQTPLQLV